MFIASGKPCRCIVQNLKTWHDCFLISNLVKDKFEISESGSDKDKSDKDIVSKCLICALC